MISFLIEFLANSEFAVISIHASRTNCRNSSIFRQADRDLIRGLRLLTCALDYHGCRSRRSDREAWKLWAWSLSAEPAVVEMIGNINDENRRLESLDIQHPNLESTEIFFPTRPQSLSVRQSAVDFQVRA
jgi:hypothetical protein